MIKHFFQKSGLRISELIVSHHDQSAHKIAVVHQIPSSDAYKIGLECNGKALMDSISPGKAQIRGKATWPKPINGSTDVYLYLGPMNSIPIQTKRHLDPFRVPLCPKCKSIKVVRRLGHENPLMEQVTCPECGFTGDCEFDSLKSNDQETLNLVLHVTGKEILSRNGSNSLAPPTDIKQFAP